MQIHQINLQRHFGGGEVYTCFFCQALDRLGIPTRLLIHPHAEFWDRLNLPASTLLVPVQNIDQLDAYLAPEMSWVLGHGPLPQALIKHIHGQGGIATAIAHMPVQGRRPEAFRNHDMVFAVSEWVLAGLRKNGITAWPEPLYGVANLLRSCTQNQIRRTSHYDWDLRKGRDRLLSWIEPLIDPLRRHPTYEKPNGLTLGIVSRITPIKQFPLLFQYIAPILAQYPDIYIDIFGSGGYGSVRDLTKAIAPIHNRVRFWGQQTNMTSVYQNIDYLLTGLPEKEALGLNIIEAQYCGTPVLAPKAPPFTETVINDVSGFLYRDPREDNGADFARMLDRLCALPHPPDPRIAEDHLAKFSFDSFVSRISPFTHWASDRHTIGRPPLSVSNTL